jgi:DNA-3-methyladenine glycosylase I
VQDEEKSFSGFVWRFVGGAPTVNCPATLRDIPAETEESRAMSKALKARGFSFVGPTICYAFMQACGLVDDHTVDCFRAKCIGPVSE